VRRRTFTLSPVKNRQPIRIHSFLYPAEVIVFFVRCHLRPFGVVKAHGENLIVFTDSRSIFSTTLAMSFKRGVTDSRASVIDERNKCRFIYDGLKLYEITGFIVQLYIQRDELPELLADAYRLYGLLRINSTDE